MKIFITKISINSAQRAKVEARLLIKRIGVQIFVSNFFVYNGSFLAILVSSCILDFRSNWPMVLTIFLATYIIMIFSRSLTNVTFCMYDVVSCYVKIALEADFLCYIKLLKSHLFYMSAGLLTHVLF
ncbi:hypothetical protein T10_2918 [Trichinella papuae]|uniref:Uncharacterized protein n=1 Tax=Trichinella papuae TaxID=268474 RepID=A0A0V1MBQ9_9BILA|nr:hypothetical protein T10_2918 [Trichinella papuae]